MNLNKLNRSYTMSYKHMIIKNWIRLGIAVAAILAYVVGIPPSIAQSTPHLGSIIPHRQMNVEMVKLLILNLNTSHQTMKHKQIMCFVPILVHRSRAKKIM